MLACKWQLTMLTCSCLFAPGTDPCMLQPEASCATPCQQNLAARVSFPIHAPSSHVSHAATCLLPVQYFALLGWGEGEESVTDERLLRLLKRATALKQVNHGTSSSWAL